MNRFALSRRELLFAAAALAFVAATSLAAFLFLAWRVEGILAARQAAVIDAEIRFLTLVDEEEGRPVLIRTIARRLKQTNDDQPIHALIDKDNTTYLAGDVDWPPGLVADGSLREIKTFRRRHGEQVTGFGRALTLRDGAKVLVGRDRTGPSSVEQALTEVILITLAALVIVAVAFVMLLNRALLLRIDAVVTAARRIIAGNLHERVPVQGGDDEFERLSAVLNTMLDKNETHINQMRLVTDAIAHDLRLPLQRVKADLERAQRLHDESERTQAFARADAEIDDALSTFNALIEITRAQSGIGADALETIDLSTIVRDVAELFEPVAEDKQQTLATHDTPARARGQGTLLRQALGNLIQNAITFSPEGATITVSTAQNAGGTVSLIVQDTGPGIPEADRATALQPFGRLSRDKNADGKGLGLALVAACAKLHGGRLTLESAGQGLRVVMELPAAQS
ncbi:MAG: HAMP domain-containing sensor histidine kinase [Alphaproteobacteria bacterium]|nr:HAMP domain-containing sensor histidine kinase [Alphaproteobacteria bacterium]